MAIQSWRQLRYHHVGIPTDQPREGEVYLPEFGMHVTGLADGPFGVEWLRFDADSPLPLLVRSQPHVAFVVDDLAAAIAGEEIVIEANSPSPGVTVAFIAHNGAPVELIHFADASTEVWPVGPQQQPPSTAALREIARRWLEEGWQAGRPEVVDELHAPGFVDHDPGGRSPDSAGFKAGIANLYAAFPDFRAELEELLVDREASAVTVHWRASGTHQGDYLGAPPSGRRVDFKGIEIIRIAGGRITERWGEWDGIELLAQLGRIKEEA